MSTQRYTPEFKEEAVRQIVDRGHSVAEVSERLGVSAHSLYKWVKLVKPDKTEQHATELIQAKSEVLKLRAQLLLVVCLTFPVPCLAGEPDTAAQLGQLYFVRDNSPDPWANLVATVTILSARPELRILFGHEPTDTELERATKVAKRTVVQVIPREEWERAMSAVFRKYMTEEELCNTLEFYQTSAGKKLLRIQVETGVEAGQALAELLRSREDTLYPLFYKLMGEEFFQIPAE